MADEKPKEKPGSAPASAPAQKDQFVEIAVILFIGFLILNTITGLTRVVTGSGITQHGWNGLSERGLILSNTRPMDSVLNPIGAPIIVSVDSTDVLSDAGGATIGRQVFGAKGTVIGGPVQVNGVNYYDVDFQDPPDGWVAENTIAYVDGQPSVLVRVLLIIWKIIDYIKYLLWLVVIALMVALVVIVRRLTAIRVNNREKLYPAGMTMEQKKSVNPKWERVLTHVESENENDWRLAIIEADIMLAELLDTMHLVGDTIGDKLKGVEKSDFVTLDLAWEAHKVRNRIAHDGSDFHITQREALRIIELYNEVFKEFQMV